MSGRLQCVIPSVARNLQFALAAIALIALSCTDALDPLASPPSPTDMWAQAVGVRSVRLTWTPVEHPDVVSYRIERRVNHEGFFVALPEPVPQSPMQVVFLDTDVEPETFYGYRVVAVTRFGDRSGPSTVAGAHTPPPPGISVRTSSVTPVPAAADPDGYRVTIVGPDTLTGNFGLTAQHRFAPLKPGTYTVTLRGVIDRCDVDADSTRSVVVPDTGVHTIAEVDFTIRCRDPQRSRVVAMVAATGDSLDQTGYVLQLTGIAADGNLPESERVFTQTSKIGGTGGRATFDNLRPGAIEIKLDSVDAHCVRAEGPTQSVTTTAGSTDTVRFRLTCDAPRPDDSNRPFAWRSTWSAASAAPQSRVFLDVALDATAHPTARIGAVQGEVRYDQSVLRFERAEAVAGGMPDLVFNGNEPGVGTILNGHNEGLSGTVAIVRIEFTVIGAAGSSVVTRSRVTEVSSADFQDFTDSARVVEDTLQIAATSAEKQPPVANAHGPYTGTAGSAIAFSSAGSIDPDGGPVTYRWTFGDGTESTEAAPSKTYATANSYQVSLIVTDDEGASTTASTTATVNASVPSDPAKPFIWRSTWPAAAASSQQEVQLNLTLDASAFPARRMASADFGITFDPALLRYERTEVTSPNAFTGVTGNLQGANVVHVAAIEPPGVTGVAGIARIIFTVIGTSGSARTQTALNEIQDANLATVATDSIRIVEDTLAIGGGGGTQAPIANANGPYLGLAGAPIAFSAAGSSDPDGGTVTYRWNFGDGSPEATAASPSKTYATPGNYTATLTVTDDEAVSTTATTNVTIAPAGPAQPLIWRYTFSAVQPNNEIVMEVLYDLTPDLPETPSIETLQSVTVDSLKWNPAVLTYMSASLGPGAGGSIIPTFTTQGKLSFTANPPSGINSGLLTVATIRFRIVGTASQSSATQTWIGIARSPSQFNYLPKTQIQEATFVVP